MAGLRVLELGAPPVGHGGRGFLGTHTPAGGRRQASPGATPHPSEPGGQRAAGSPPGHILPPRPPPWNVRRIHPPASAGLFPLGRPPPRNDVTRSTSVPPAATCRQALPRRSRPTAHAPRLRPRSLGLSRQRHRPRAPGSGNGGGPGGPPPLPRPPAGGGARRRFRRRPLPGSAAPLSRLQPEPAPRGPESGRRPTLPRLRGLGGRGSARLGPGGPRGPRGPGSGAGSPAGAVQGGRAGRPRSGGRGGGGAGAGSGRSPVRILRGLGSPGGLRCGGRSPFPTRITAGLQAMRPRALRGH